jgi:hypothetical protein
MRHIEARRLGESIAPVQGRVERVADPAIFAGVFQRNDKVLDTHQFVVNPTRPRESVRKIIAESNRLKREGFAGMYGDTPNPLLVSIWKNEGAVVVPSPPEEAKIAREHYKRGVKLLGFPRKYADSPVMRILFRFR